MTLSQAELSDVLEHTTAASFVIDLEGKILHANSRASELFKYSPEELIGLNVVELTAKKVRRFFRKALRSFFLHPARVGLSRTSRISGEDREGNPFTASVMIHPVDLEAGTVAVCSFHEVNPGDPSNWGIENDIEHSVFEPHPDILVMNAVLDKEAREREHVEAELLDYQNLLHEAQTVAGLGWYVLDLEKGTWQSSGILDRIFGIDDSFPHTVEGWLRIVHPDWREEMQRYFTEDVIRKRRSFDKVYRIVTHDTGEERWVHGLGKLDLDAQGNPVRMIGVIDDVTDQMHLEKALVRSNQFLRALSHTAAAIEADHAPQQILETIGAGLEKMGIHSGVALRDKNNRELIVHYISLDSDHIGLVESVLGIKLIGYRIRFGQKSGANIRRTFRSQLSKFLRNASDFLPAIFPDHDQGTRLEEMATAIGLHRHSAFFLPMVSGQEVIGAFILWGANLQEDDSHALSVFVNQIVSVFERARLQEQIQEELRVRKLAEETARKESEFAMQVMESIGEGLTVVDKDGRFEYVNPTYASWVGKRPVEMIGLTPKDFTVQQDWPVLEKANRLRQSGKVNSYETRLIGPNGHQVPVMVTGSPRLEDGRVTGTIALITNLTEIKEYETSLRRRDAILTAISSAAERFLRTEDWERDVQIAIEELGKGAQASRTYIFEFVEEAEGDILCSQRFEWVQPGIEPQIDNPDLQRLPMIASGFGRWYEAFKKGKSIHGPIRRFPDTERDLLRAQDIQSLLVAPIFVEARPWGFIGFDDCLQERTWDVAEIEALKTAGDILGAAIQKKTAVETLRKRSQEHEVLYQMAKTISAELSLDALLQNLTRELTKLAGRDGCAIYLVDYERDVMITQLDFSRKHPQLTDPPGKEYPLSNLPTTRRALNTGQPLFLHPDQIKIDASEREYMLENQIHSLLLLPMISGSKVIGLIKLYDEKNGVQTVGGKQGEESTILFESLAAQAAVAIENARLFEDARLRLHRNIALREINDAILEKFELTPVLDLILKKVVSELDVDAADILLYEEDGQSLTFAASYGFRTPALNFTNLSLGWGFAGLAAERKHMVSIPDLRQERGGIQRSLHFETENFVGYIAVPLVAKGKVKGVLEIFHREGLNPGNEWLTFLETLARQAAIAIENVSLFEDLDQANAELIQAYDATLKGWSKALDLRDKETEGHTERVAEMTLRLATALGVPEDKLVHMWRGALLHDIGKMGIPDSILLKPGPLTDEEWEIMYQHPTMAYRWLAEIPYLREALDIPYCHHEKWDGTGYPRGLKGEEIPLAARIFAVVDVWDALTSDRPYRKAWSREDALMYIRSQSGKHFDPRMVKVFFSILE